jgi:hypothetical protein
MVRVPGRYGRRGLAAVLATFGALAVGGVGASTASAASCDVVDSTIGFTSSVQYSVKGYAVGCRPYGTDYEWRLTVYSEGQFVWTETGLRYNPGSSWQTATFYRPGAWTAVYCATFRVRNHATNNIIGEGSTCT